MRKQRETLSQKLYIGNLPFDTTQTQIRDLFSKAGGVADVYLSKNRFTSKSSGFGFVEMDTETAAHKAIELFHGHLLGTRPMTVQAVDTTSTAEWKGASNTVVYRKLPRPVEESQNDDGKN